MEIPKNHSPRIHHLDSIRGIAALGVAFHHSFYCFNGIACNQFIRCLAGASSVVFFFLLSGFVLSSSLHSADQFSFSNISKFYIKRFFRLFPAIFSSLFLALFIASYNHMPVENSGVSEWLRQMVVRSHQVVSVSEILKQLFLLKFDLIPPMWSIRVEIIGSLLLPILIWVLRRHPLILMPLMAFLAFILSLPFKYSADFGYLLAFLIGYLIYRMYPILLKLSSSQTKMSLGFASIIWISSIQYGFIPSLECFLLGGLLSILAPCSWLQLKKVFNLPVFRFLGKISYSFYLVHLPILLASVSFLSKNFSSIIELKNPYYTALICFFISSLIAVPVAWLMEILIEKPFNRLGHLLTENLSNS